jgi:hypothetical protein
MSKNPNCNHRFVLALLLAVTAAFPCLTMTAGGRSAQSGQLRGAADPRREMITELPAPGPNASIGDKAQAFDRFVGTWDTDYTFYAADGTINKRTGEVLFGWVIDGRALQDIWISYPKDGERDLGTTIRFYDDKTALWRIVWIYPKSSVITTLIGGPVGDRIVLRGQGSDGGLLRWSFNEIQTDSFIWRGEVSYNNGETWRLTGEYHMKRRKPAAR